MNTVRAVFIIVLATLSVQVWGVNCSSTNINLSTQEDVDTFQTTYGSGGTCDTVTGILSIWGNDISNLIPLSALKSVQDLQIKQSLLLTNIDGLSSLTNVGGYLRILDTVLTDIDGLIQDQAIFLYSPKAKNYSFPTRSTRMH